MIVLGIDPGSSIIGYGAIEVNQGKLKCLDYGVIKTAEKDDSLRLLSIKNSLEKILSKVKPDLIVLEKLFFFKNRKTAIRVSETRGAMILVIAEKRIPLAEIAPLELKKALTNYGRASKINIQKMVKLILNLKKEPEPDDAADALALAIVGSRT